MCEISRGEATWRQEARGKKRAGYGGRRYVKKLRVEVWHGKHKIQWRARVYPERESQVALPLQSLVLWAPRKARWVREGRVAKYLFGHVLLLFVKAGSAATLPLQEKKKW
jgi:hypothetical protein